jgi:hypothetical protein
MSTIVKKIRAYLGFGRTPDPDLLKLLNAVHDGMKNNSAYANPPVALVDFETAIDSFSTLMTDAEDGGKRAMSAKRKQRAVVVKMVTQLGHYVEAACNDDVATFNTSGFTAVPTVRANTPQPLGNAAIKWVDRGANSGQVLIRVASLTGAVSYELRYGVVGNGGAPPATWTSLPLAGTKTVTLNNLTAGVAYAFQVRALGRLGYCDWSDSATFICG